MAHIQSKPVHDSEAEQKKGFQTVNAKDNAADSPHRYPQKEGRYIDNTKRQPVGEPSHEFRVMGLPWQLVWVLGVMAGGVILIVLKAIGLV